ncbi:OLC1v1004673C1 [Oldenlandia corymbosa var. corymbosa]|uniref:OLC1v1004673C1 n=1 Tax=Oldenlandia corymbosa var. corymbosa TaxID=529605 RepID=A0AAV1DFC4_OLDCO|nr:OLC1v1004673C1 [Oldenlandia corymbosa var. corymbosa]
MTTLNSKKILEENNGSKANSITTLILTQRALSDVSCLSEFKNLERLDLSFNTLTSLEGLKSCVNLKWLSVVQNKLESLEGIQGLTKLNVLNAGRNKLKSMEGLRSLVNLNAIILNGNDITSICKLDQMKELNTLVLSHNPITEIGDALAKTKSITKLSLSYCQLQTIGSSLISCAGLKELRLAHNEIKTLPMELSRNDKLLNLDIGTNLITNFSDVKVLSSLVNLRNLNLMGNPIAEKDSLVKKIKNLLPKLKIFNGRPTDKFTRKDDQRAEKSITGTDGSLDQKKALVTSAMGKKNSKKKFLSDDEEDDSPGSAGDGSKEEFNNKKRGKGKEQPTKTKENDHNAEKKRKKQSKLESDDIVDASNHPSIDTDEEGKDLKRKKQEHTTNSGPGKEKQSSIPRKGDTKFGKKKLKQNAGGGIDDAETPFEELFAAGDAENATNKDQTTVSKKQVQDIDTAGGFVVVPKKNKKNKQKGVRASIADLTPSDEVGLGGPSSWDP